ncbi:MFS transporter [Streptomyces sp. NPDC020412]|uniref:MFS transporter n=1 Tax=Streptomyces sp. NPDC020412 TaxID=3365073 RepID=UPI0037A931C5
MSPSVRPGLLRDPDFRRLFAATALGQFGDRVVFLVLPLVAIAALDADELQVGLLAALTSAGSFLVGLPAGAWVDRVRKRRVLIVTDLARALVLATVPVAWWAGCLTFWWLGAVAFLHGSLTVFFDVAYLSYLPHLVERDGVEVGCRMYGREARGLPAGSPRMEARGGRVSLGTRTSPSSECGGAGPGSFLRGVRARRQV